MSERRAGANFRGAQKEAPAFLVCGPARTLSQRVRGLLWCAHKWHRSEAMRRPQPWCVTDECAVEEWLWVCCACLASVWTANDPRPVNAYGYQPRSSPPPWPPRSGWPPVPGPIPPPPGEDDAGAAQS